jgi:hypothetical protein
MCKWHVGITIFDCEFFENVENKVRNIVKLEVEARFKISASKPFLHRF